MVLQKALPLLTALQKALPLPITLQPVRPKQQQGLQTFMNNAENISDALDSAHAQSIYGASKSTEEFKKGMSDIGWHPKMSHLIEVEAYLKSKFPLKGLQVSYDSTAKEELYFKTINYTTFAGFFMIHPMAFEQCIRQISDAYADTTKPVGHIDYLVNKINKEKTFSKYNYLTTVDTPSTEALVILPGGNKIKKHCCVGKIQIILDKHGRDNVLFKKHPISHNDVYEELSEYLGGIQYADKHSDLFNLMKESDFIYSTMVSESALIAHILGKSVGHIDLLQNRDTASFAHINYYLYSHPNPLEWADKTFASPKSGIIHPEIDKNWMKKIDEYLEYIVELRNFYREAYRLA